MAPVSPITLRFQSAALEAQYRTQATDSFGVYLPLLVVVLVAMNVTRIVLYNVNSTGTSELGWSIPLLVLSLCLRCFLWFRRLKLLTILLAQAMLYVTCGEWIVTFSQFFCFEVRAIIVSLGVVNVFVGMFLLSWEWLLYLGGLTLGTVYITLRTNLAFQEQDVAALVLTGLLPAVIVYMHLYAGKTAFSSLITATSQATLWKDAMDSLPSSVILLDRTSVLYSTPTACDTLHNSDPQTVPLT